MSRHTIYKSPDLEIIVGWDRPLQELYVQTIQPDPDDEEEEIYDSMEWQCLVPSELANQMPDLWRVVRDHMAIPQSIIDSVTKELIKEYAVDTMEYCNQCIDWTKGIPTEGI